jgi:hypothetical protein
MHMIQLPSRTSVGRTALVRSHETDIVIALPMLASIYRNSDDIYARKRLLLPATDSSTPF